jgi:hypothetical protein
MRATPSEDAGDASEMVARAALRRALRIDFVYRAMRACSAKDQGSSCAVLDNSGAGWQLRR